MHLDVLGIGNALVDIVSEGDDNELARLNLPKGSMTLVDVERAAALYDQIGPSIESSGGSAANTMVGLAQAGHRVGFIGRVREDQLGAVFSHDLRACGVDFHGIPAANGDPTGRCFVIVTPDGERTMATSLGASNQIDPNDVDEAHLIGARMLYLEGYLWDLEDAKATLRSAAETAGRHGTKVAFSLSDPFCVERHREEFLDFISTSVDIVFANQDEAFHLTGTSTIEAATSAVSSLAELVVITHGAEGCSVVLDGNVQHFPAVAVPKLVDTTGAGDAFAAGYLDGLLRDLEPEECALRGATRASAILGHFGARLLAAGSEQVGMPNDVLDR
ncbi:MAG: adenosine kinase [Acidimicrobiia bacterium]